ncbi:substrate-binding domain-containing protein, partial [Novosphingobium sp. Chol11]|uniref:substrate-binding domain-containing protein n=1 Tax=Novosphingobium sp. Chol11 TaxID=1385763 RepID=UPI0025EEB7E9
MANFKSMLLAATVVAGTVASPAFAQTTQIPLPAPSTFDGALHGTGASSINNIVPRMGNCIGIDNARGNSSGSAFTLVPAGLYTDPTASLSLDCSIEAQNLQPNSQVKYVSTGSGFGRQMWRNFRDDFLGSATPTAGVSNPFNTAAIPAVIGNGTAEAPQFPAVPATSWSNVQFGFTDAPVTPGDIVTYNTRAAPSAGAAIAFPLYLLPVAIAYNARYGINAAGADMFFNARGRGIVSPATGAPFAAIRLPKAAYCGIFNGTLKNWNEPIFKSANLNTALFDVSNDTAARWAADGAPIRLVGRMDRSGTTDIFTRHLAAVCNATSAPGVAPTGTPGRAT